jgi:hypothetical protein
VPKKERRRIIIYNYGFHEKLIFIIIKLRKGYFSRSPLEEQFCIFKIFKMAAKTWHKKWAVKIQHCPISSKFDMWVDNDVPN